MMTLKAWEADYAAACARHIDMANLVGVPSGEGRDRLEREVEHSAEQLRRYAFYGDWRTALKIWRNACFEAGFKPSTNTIARFAHK